MPKALLMYAPPPEHLAALQRLGPGFRFVSAQSEDHAKSEVADAEVILGNRYLLQSLPHARALRWAQSNSVGMDLILSDPRAREGDFALTNARGVYDDEMADHTLALVLALLRGLPTGPMSEPRGWVRRPLPRLADCPVLLFGFGGVGRAVAHRLTAFGARTTIVRRTGQRAAGDPDLVYVDPAEARRRLPEARVVILAAPLTNETRHLLDAEALGRLADGAFLVNVARGELIDENALGAEIDRLGGVGLDVFEREPLPDDAWLWRHPKLIATPHVARSPDADRPRWLPLFEENFGRWVSGRSRLNRVDRALGY